MSEVEETIKEQRELLGRQERIILAYERMANIILGASLVKDITAIRDVVFETDTEVRRIAGEDEPD